MRAEVERRGQVSVGFTAVDLDQDPLYISSPLMNAQDMVNLEEFLSFSSVFGELQTPTKTMPNSKRKAPVQLLGLVGCKTNQQCLSRRIKLKHIMTVIFLLGCQKFPQAQELTYSYILRALSFGKCCRVELSQMGRLAKIQEFCIPGVANA